MKATRSLAIVTMLMGLVSLEAAILEGTKFYDYPANAEKHVISIKRDAETPAAEKMIEIAERAKPATGVWWNIKEGKEVLVMDLKTPYALTASALKYYVAQIEDYKKMDWTGRVAEPSSRLEYTAAVARHETFTLDGKDYENVYVVNLKIVFRTAYTVEAFGGTNFAKQRTVVLDADGIVLAIAGDKEENFAMWMI